MHTRALWLVAAIVALQLGGAAFAGQVGERHITGVNPTAALRDVGHSDTVRVTVWYPAAADAKEVSLDLGPPGKPLFLVGSAAPDAVFLDDARRPAILFSARLRRHGADDGLVHPATRPRWLRGDRRRPPRQQRDGQNDARRRDHVLGPARRPRRRARRGQVRSRDRIPPRPWPPRRRRFLRWPASPPSPPRARVPTRCDCRRSATPTRPTASACRKRSSRSRPSGCWPRRSRPSSRRRWPAPARITASPASAPPLRWRRRSSSRSTRRA